MKVQSLFLTAALMAGPALASGASVPETRTGISKVIAAEDAAWKAGDARAFCAAALPDVVFTNIVGMFSVGIEPMTAQHARIFATIYKGSVVDQTIVNLKMVSANVAIVDTLARVTGFHGLPPGVQAPGGVLRTRLEQVMVLDGNGHWGVASFHNVPINPAADAPPPS